MLREIPEIRNEELAKLKVLLFQLGAEKFLKKRLNNDDRNSVKSQPRDRDCAKRTLHFIHSSSKPLQLYSEPAPHFHN